MVPKLESDIVYWMFHNSFLSFHCCCFLHSASALCVVYIEARDLDPYVASVLYLDFIARAISWRGKSKMAWKKFMTMCTKTGLQFPMLLELTIFLNNSKYKKL